MVENPIYNLSMQHLQIALLGKPAIKLNGAVVETDRHKAIALLAYLAVEDKSYSRDSLAALLWPEYPRASAFAYLRRTLWELNSMLGKGWLEADRENVRLLRSPSLDVDVEAFRQLASQPAGTAETLVQAVELYRGDFLEGLVVADTAPFEEWQMLQSESYRRDLAKALEKLIAGCAENGEYEQALPYAQRWLALDRLDERAWRALMRQQAGMGDRNGAAHTYQSCSETLKAELGVAPQPETDELYQAILHGELTLNQIGKAEITEVIQTKRKEGNLPIPATPFIGRAEEIQQITQLALDPQVHLLTLTGPGGTGKTRLSIQVSAKMNGTFPDGVWFIPLAAVQSVQGIVSAIAQGFNFSFYKGTETPRQQLLDYLREKRLMLVLDNFEHLMEEGRQLVADILGAAGGVKLMITSRERLNLQPEQVYRVAGMSVPERAASMHWANPEKQAETYSGIQLLVERARRVRPDFQLTRENLPAVMEICELVDGSPLGIELAATWIEVLPEEEIAREIVHSLDFLESTAVDTPARQRSLRMVFETSWRLLTSEEQQAFRRLCVFRGSFSRPAAQEVSGASLRTLLGLANKSWLQQNDNGRYQLHEVLKQYGTEHLKADPDEWQEMKDRQAEFLIKFMEENGQALHTSQQIQALQAMMPELVSNFPDAWEWLVSCGRIEDLISRLLPGLVHYRMVRGPLMDDLRLIKLARKAASGSADHTHGLQRTILEIAETYLELNLYVFDDHPKERLERLWRMVHESHLEDELGFWYVMLVDTYTFTINFQEGSKRFEEYLDQAGDLGKGWEAGNCYLLAGWFAGLDNKRDKQEVYLLKALEIFKKIGVLQEQGTTLRALGDLARLKKDYEVAIEYILAAQKYYEQVGDEMGIGATWIELGEYYLYLGKINEAFHAFEELRHYSERMGNHRTLGNNLSWESLQHSRYGQLEFALELRQRSLALAREVGNQHDAVWATWELGEIYRLMGELELASKYYHQARPTFYEMKDFIGLGFFHRGLGDMAAMQSNWPEAQKEYREALTYHTEEQRSNRSWGLALTHSRLGTALVHTGELDEAREHLRVSLALAIQWTNPDLKALPLTGIAEWLSVGGQKEKALELAACVASKPTTWNEVKQEARAIIIEAEAALPADQANIWEASGEKMAIDEACKKYGGEDSF